MLLLNFPLEENQQFSVETYNFLKNVGKFGQIVVEIEGCRKARMAQW